LNLLFIDQNEVEPLIQLMGDELFLVNDLVWYDQIPSEGENKFRYLNIFDFESEHIIPEDFREEFFKLHRVVSKGEYTMDLSGLAAINLHQVSGIRLKNILEKFTPKYITLWGIDSEKLGLKVDKMKGLIHNGVKIMNLETSDKILTDSALYQKCELYLKQMFGIK